MCICYDIVDLVACGSLLAPFCGLWAVGLTSPFIYVNTLYCPSPSLYPSPSRVLSFWRRGFGFLPLLHDWVSWAVLCPFALGCLSILRHGVAPLHGVPWLGSIPYVHASYEWDTVTSPLSDSDPPFRRVLGGERIGWISLVPPPEPPCMRRGR